MIVADRIKQAEAIIAAIGDISGIRPPYVHPDCNHVYYTIPFLIERKWTEFCTALREAGVPIVEGYVRPSTACPRSRRSRNIARLPKTCTTTAFFISRTAPTTRRESRSGR